MRLRLLRAMYTTPNSWASLDNLEQRIHDSVAKKEIKINIKWEKKTSQTELETERLKAFEHRTC